MWSLLFLDVISPPAMIKLMGRLRVDPITKQYDQDLRNFLLYVNHVFSYIRNYHVCFYSSLIVISKLWSGRSHNSNICNLFYLYCVGTHINANNLNKVCGWVGYVFNLNGNDLLLIRPKRNRFRLYIHV